MQLVTCPWPPASPSLCACSTFVFVYPYTLTHTMKFNSKPSLHLFRRCPMVHENFPKWRRPRVALSELRTKSLPQSVGVWGGGRVGNSKQYIRTPGTPLHTHTHMNYRVDQQRSLSCALHKYFCICKYMGYLRHLNVVQRISHIPESSVFPPLIPSSSLFPLLVSYDSFECVRAIVCLFDI